MSVTRIFVLVMLWFVGLMLFQALQKSYQIEKYNETLIKNPSAFPDCTNCVRYYDIVLCKCKEVATQDQVAFLYPTDLTPDLDLSKISIGVGELPNTDVPRVPDTVINDIPPPVVTPPTSGPMKPGPKKVATTQVSPPKTTTSTTKVLVDPKKIVSQTQKNGRSSIQKTSPR